MECSLQINAQDKIPVFVLHFVQVVVRDKTGNAGAVHQNIETAQLPDDGCNHRPAGITVPHVCFHR